LFAEGMKHFGVNASFLAVHDDIPGGASAVRFAGNDSCSYILIPVT
jgi:hypothetical protein